MPKRPLGVLSIGVLVVILAISAALRAAAILHNLSEVFSLTFLLFGLWVIVLAGLRASNPEIYGHGAFNVFSGGLLITTLGVAWLLSIYGFPAVYLLATVLLILGILVVAVAIRTWRK